MTTPHADAARSGYPQDGSGSGGDDDDDDDDDDCRSERIEERYSWSVARLVSSPPLRDHCC